MTILHLRFVNLKFCSLINEFVLIPKKFVILLGVQIRLSLDANQLLMEIDQELVSNTKMG